MKLYIYAQSGHSFGLDKVRKAAVLCKKLHKYDPILATADYRAATFAKDQLDVPIGLGVDVITNLPHMMSRNDFLIYDSNEINDFTKNHMEEYCSLLYEVGENITNIIVDDLYKDPKKSDHQIDKLFFYGNDDYKDTLLIQIKNDTNMYNIPLLMGHYMFFGNEDKLKVNFSNLIDEEEYNDTIKQSKYILSGSEQTALEGIANNANPVLLLRNDKQYIHLDLFEEWGIPIIKQDNKTLTAIFEEFDTICEKYPSIKRDIFDTFDIQIDEILEKLSSYDKIIELTKNYSRDFEVDGIE